MAKNALMIDPHTGQPVEWSGARVNGLGWNGIDPAYQALLQKAGLWNPEYGAAAADPGTDPASRAQFRQQWQESPEYQALSGSLAGWDSGQSRDGYNLTDWLRSPEGQTFGETTTNKGPSLHSNDYASMAAVLAAAAGGAALGGSSAGAGSANAIANGALAGGAQGGTLGALGATEGGLAAAGAGAAGAGEITASLAGTEALPASFSGFEGVGAVAEKAAAASFWDTAAGQAIIKGGTGALAGALQAGATGGDVKNGAVGGAIGGGVQGYTGGSGMYAEDDGAGGVNYVDGNANWGTQGGSNFGSSLGDFFSGNGSVSDYLRAGQFAGGLIAQNKAAGAAQSGNDAQNALLSQMYQQNRADNQPLLDVRNQTLPQIQNLLKNPGSITSDPGYQFGLKQGANQLNNRAAASGNYYSGAQMKAAQQYGQDYAGTKLDQSLNRLMGVATGTQVGGQNNQQNNTNFGVNGGNALQQGGNIRGSGYFGQFNTANNAANNWMQDQYDRKYWGGGK